jgi:hypothetical protein
MTLSDLAAIGSIVSSLAVAVSIFYLGVQTHQATKHTKALISQGRSARMSDFIGAFSETDRAAAIIEITSGSPATPALIKRLQTTWYFMGCIAGWVDVFEQHATGLLSDDHLDDMRAAVAMNMRTAPAYEIWQQWKAARPDTHASFKARMDDIIAASKPAGGAHEEGARL